MIACVFFLKISDMVVRTKAKQKFFFGDSYMISHFLPHETRDIVLQNICFNAVGVALFLINSLYFLAQHNVIHVMD